jgi:hypothetical protein
MKLTWFGNTALRVYTGGRIVVIDPGTAPGNVDRQELVAGADRVLALADNDARLVDTDRWRPRVARPLEPEPALEILTIGASTLLIAGPGEPPLLIADVVELPHLGRWADGAVFVLFGERGAGLAETISMLNRARPRLLAMAAQEHVVDALFEKLAQSNDHFDVPRVASLEPGLALEV